MKKKVLLWSFVVLLLLSIPVAFKLIPLENLPEEESKQPVDHTHTLATVPQLNSELITGYCGNIQTTVYFDNKEYTFMYDRSVELTNILVNLKYDTTKLCKCPHEYTVDTEFGEGYGIDIAQGFVRSDKGQAELTEEQLKQVKEIILWVKDKV